MVLVGREVELSAVRAALEADTPAVVVGEAGIGKTALVRAAIEATGRRAYEGGGFATLAWKPYLALSRAIGHTVDGEHAAAAATVERTVGPDVLFVDDLQWADRETRAVVALLAGRIGLVAAVRDGDPETPAALALLTEAGARVIPLRGLDAASAAALAEALRPDLAGQAIERLVRRAGGNPLLLEELASRGRPSRTLAQAIARQLDALGGRERQALELLAIADRPLATATLGPAGRRLAAMGLVHEVQDGLEVRHALIAEAIVAGLAAGVRSARHRHLARLVAEPAEVARHLLAGGRAASAKRLALVALEDATDPRDRAALLVTAATAGGGAAAGRIRVSAAQQLQAIGDDGGAVRVLDAPMPGDDELLALRAAVLAESLSRLGRQAEAWDVISAAEGLRPDPRSEASVELALSRASALVNVHGRLADGIEVLEQTVALRSPAGRPLQVRGLLATLRLLSGEGGQVEQLERVWSESLQAGDGATAASTAMNLDTGLLIERGAGPALSFAVEAARRLADLGLVGRASALRVEGTQVALFAGDLGETVMLADGLLEEPLGPRPRCRLLAIRGLALAWLGRYDAARDSLAESERLATPEFEGLGEVHHGRAELALWSGRPERARTEAMAAVELPAVSDANYVLPALTRSWAELELGRQPAALPNAPSMRVLAGASPEHAGIRALARDEPEPALAAFDEAAAAWAGFHRPRELVCRWGAGEAARRAGRVDLATARLETALGEATVAGFEPLVARIRRSLRLAGVRMHARTPFVDGPGIGLTARERELVSLVERGLTNVEIARRLGLGRPTVARILASAMTKAGVDSRAQLAARELA